MSPPAMSERTTILLGDAVKPPQAHRYQTLHAGDLVFLDPPYGQGLIAPALTALGTPWLDRRAKR